MKLQTIRDFQSSNQSTYIKYSSLLMFSPKGTFLQNYVSLMDKLIINQSFQKETIKCIRQSLTQVLQMAFHSYC